MVDWSKRRTKVKPDSRLPSRAFVFSLVAWWLAIITSPAWNVRDLESAFDDQPEATGKESGRDRVCSGPEM